MPLEVKLETKGRQRVKREEIVEMERSVWSEEGVKHYHEKCEGWFYTQTKTENIWKVMMEKVKESILKIKRKRMPWNLGRRNWHSIEWKAKKRELRKELGKLRRGRIKRKDYREWCKIERQKYKKEEEDKIKSIRRIPRRKRGNILISTGRRKRESTRA